MLLRGLWVDLGGLKRMLKLLRLRLRLLSLVVLRLLWHAVKGWGIS